MTTVERTDAMPPKGAIAPFDAGWFAHEVGLERETVAACSIDPGWALLGWDCRQAVEQAQERG